MKKLTLVLLSMVSFCAAAGSTQATPAHPFIDTMQAHLSSLPVPVSATPTPKPDNEKTWWEKLTGLEEPTFKSAKLDRYQELALTYNLVGPHFPASTQDLVNKNVWKDLEYFCGTATKSINLVQLLNRTILPEGEFVLGYFLTTPTTNITTLTNRQAVISTLRENEHLSRSLHKALLEVKHHHDAIYSFWSQESQSNKLFVDAQYWQSKSFKKLNTDLSYQYAIRPFNKLTGAAVPVMTVALPYLIYLGWNTMDAENRAYAFLGEAYFGLLTYFSYEGYKREFQTLRYLHERANGIAALMRAMEAIEKGLDNNPVFDTLRHRSTIKAFAKNKKTLSRKLRYLHSVLRKDTFKGEPSYFVLRARVKVAFALIEQIKQQLTPALAAVGEIDAYLSCATLYKEHEGKENGFVFAQYLQQDTPAIAMEAMWNPFVGSEKSVVNSVEIGTHAPRNIILTGPNAGGKSTFAKGLTLNILLAQTLGIVPARSFSLTPFSVINTYMNISDDTAGGNSLFKSEVLRAQALLESVEALPAGKFAFSVMDEMFSGTSPKEGEAASYAVAENLGHKPQSVLLLATHFPELKKLESVTGLFKNYQVRVVRHADGTFSYPFKLELGAADQNVAFDILQQQGFSSSILDKAQEILARKK